MHMYYYNFKSSDTEIIFYSKTINPEILDASSANGSHLSAIIDLVLSIIDLVLS